MLRRVASASVLGATNPQPILRNVCAVVVKRYNATIAATQVLTEEWDNAKPFEDIPGPKPLPVIGNLWRFLPYIGEMDMEFTDQQEYLHKTYGDIVKLTGMPGRNDMVMIFDPNQIEKVYRNEGPWPNRNAMHSSEYYRSVTRKDFFEGIRGAVVSQGPEWQQFRSKVNPPMMQPRSAKLYVGPIDAVAQDFINRIRILRDEKQEMPDDFNNELYKWALESIVYIALDTRLGCLNDNLQPDSEPQKMIEAVQITFDCLYKLDLKLSPWKYISTPAWRRFVKASDYFLEVSMKYIDQATERLKSLPPDSDRELTVLEKLLARDDNPKTAIVMAMDMIGAGIDTTSYATAVALYFLAKNPDKQQKLFEEIHRYLPDKNQPVTSEILNDMKYLRACVKESMRIRPIAIGNIRMMQKDIVLSNYRVPKGVDVVSPNFYLCQQEKYFSQADKFIPERWLKSDDGKQPETKMTHPFVYMPFGFGVRMCLGRRFAELELETMVTKAIRNFHVEYNYGDMKFQSKLLYTPISPLKFKFVDRAE